jgi:hypothetical protein
MHHGTNNNSSEIIGFDLGHGESAVTIAVATALTEPQVLDVQGRKSMITAVAQHPHRGVLIGEDAYTAKNLQNLRIRFKSSQLNQPGVREPIRLFAEKVLRILTADGKIKGNGESHFIVGCPSGWNQNTRTDYALLLKEAGLNPVTVMAESRAAFLNAKEAGDLSVKEEQLAGSVLIIDVGSSTTDFTAVQSLKEYPIDFGHNELGAGLIDVAILERTLQTHRDKHELIRIFSQAPHVKAKCELKCRKVKEMFFSNEEKYAEDPAKDVELIEGEKDILFQVKLSQQEMAEIISTPLPGLGNHSWQDAFQEALLISKERTKNVPPQLVLLTGGASRMGFIRRLAEGVFPEARVLLGAEPEFAIAKGLAWAGRIDQKTKAFRDEVDGVLYSEQVSGIVKNKLPELLYALADTLAQKLPEGFILPAFTDWQKGQIKTLASLEPLVESRLESWLASPEGKKALAQPVVHWFDSLKPQIEGLTNPICDKYHIRRSSLSLPSSKAWGGKVPPGLFDPKKMFALDDFADILNLIVSSVVGTIMGGAGTALLLKGPVGWIVGFLFAAVVIAFGKDKALDYIKNTDFPVFTRKLALKKVIEWNLRKGEPELKEKIMESFSGNPKAMEKIAHGVTGAIRDQLNKSADAAELLIK